MGQLISVLRFWTWNELGLVPCRVYNTRYYNLSLIKLQPGSGTLFVTANESGTLLLFDTFSKSELPQQFRVLSPNVGGVSDLFWINSEIFVVGTMRGHLVVYSLANDARRLFEVCNLKAHGDGASQVAVQSIDYDARSRCIATVGQGLNSIRLWNIAEDGTLTPRPMDSSPTAYDEPRFVAFGRDGLSLSVGYLENMTVRTFSLSTWGFTDQKVLGQEAGAFDDRELGNAVVLDEGRILIFNLKDGLDIYDTASFNKLASARFEIDGCCSQAISTLQKGSYVLSSSSTKGCVDVYRTNDASQRGRMFIKGGSSDRVQAIHSITDDSKRDIAVAVSCAEGRPSRISVWMAGSLKNQPKTKTADYSTARIVLLCILVYGLCHLAKEIFPPLSGKIFTQPGTPVSARGISDLAGISTDDKSSSIYIPTDDQGDQIPTRALRPWTAIHWP